MAEHMVISRLHQHSAKVDGFWRTWRVYTPASYDGAQLMPAVLTLHGGDHALAHERTTWHLLAESEGFLVVYPEALTDGVMWNAWDCLSRKDGRPDDAAFLNWLIDWLLEAYAVDPARIYLHGQSMGDMMGTHFAFIYPDRIAAAALCSGPTKTKWWLTKEGQPRFLPSGSCPVLRLHGENDVFQASSLQGREAWLYKRQCHIDINDAYWITANDCDAASFVTTKDRNIVLYAGKDGIDYISMTVCKGEHRPPLETEKEIWDNLFLRYRLEKGTHVRTKAEPVWRPDAGAIAVAVGSSKCCYNNRVYSMSGHVPIVREGVLYIDAAGLRPWLTELVLPNELRKAEIDGVEMVPFTELMEANDYAAAQEFGAGYAALHTFTLSFDLAYTIRRFLGVQPALTMREAFEKEDEIFRIQCLDKGFEPPKNRLEEIWIWGHTI